MSRSRIAILGASVSCFELADLLASEGVTIAAMVPPRGGTRSGVARRAAAAGIVLVDVGTSINAEGSHAQLAALGCDLFVNWGHGERFGAPVLGAARLGTLNLHPGAIPGARGLEPVFGAMVEGWPAITQTVHRMSVRLDDGPVVATRSIPIDDAPYRDVVEERLRDGAVAFYGSAIRAVLSGCNGTPAEGPSRYFPALTPADEMIDWSQPAAVILRRVRALSPFLPARSWIDGVTRLQVWRAEAAGQAPPGVPPGHVVRVAEGRAEVATGEGLVRLTHCEAVSVEAGLRAGARLGLERARS